MLTGVDCIIGVFLFVDSFIDVLLIPNPRAISALFTLRLLDSQCVRGGKKKPEKRTVNAGRPITVTTAIVLLIQSIGGEDAPKTEGKKGKKKTPQPVLPRSCAPLFENRMCWNALCLFSLAPLNRVLFFSISHQGVLWGVRSG